MPNPRANRPLTLDQVTADLKSLSQPAQALFDMVAGGLRGSAVGTFGAPGDIETLARMGLNAAGGSFNPAMPSRSGRAFQPVSEEPYFPSSEELAKRFAPTIPNGDPVRRKSAEPFEEIGQFAPLPMSGKALKVLPYALGRGTGMATKEVARAINDAMVYQTGPLSQGPLSMLAPKGAVSHVVKPKGGNWLGGGMKGASAGDVDERLGRLKTPTIAGDTPAQRIPLHEALLKDPTLNQDQIDRVLYQLEATKGEAAVDQWIANNVGNYIKKDMATPTDPVRLMFERRAQEIEAQFQTDMGRAERTRARAEAETDPRRQANLTRQAAQQEEQAKFDKDFAMEHITHLPKDEWGDLSKPSEELMQKRQREGFQMLGEAKSDPAQRWENLTDEAVGINRAGDVQAQKDAMIKAQDTERAFLNKDDEINQTFRPRLIEILAQKGEKLLDKDIDALVKITPTSEKATILGEREIWSDLRNQAQQARIDVNSGLWDAYNKNKWVDKLDPETNVYSAYIGDLGIDHVVDVIRQDVAAGRIRPEQLNKLSMDQAIQRTAEFNMEQAKKMRDTAIKQTEGMPTHKEYSDEGYKWIELRQPEAKLEEGHSIVQDKPSTSNWKVVPHPDGEGYALRADNGQMALDGRGIAERKWNSPQEARGSIAEYAEIQEPDADALFKVVDQSGNTISVGATEKEALKLYKRQEREQQLADALKYEGDTMGHCVGGYCPDVVEGRSRIYSLRDKRGEPHVTVEVNPASVDKGTFPVDTWFKSQPKEMQDAITNAGYTGYNIRHSPQFKEAEKNAPPSIRQIKGKGNARPVEKYDPYTQDFVRSGEWSDVGDIGNTGLIQQHSLDRQIAKDQFGLDLPKYTTQQESKDYMTLDVDRYYQGAKNLEIPESLLKYKIQPELPTEGMKHGGSVHISDNPDTMMMELGDKRMKGGGAEDDTKPFIGYPNLAKQARYSRAVAPERGDVNLLKDPQTYAFVMGALGEAPDELGFTALDSDEQKQKIKAAGEKGFVTGAVSQLGPLAQLGKKAGKKILSLAGEGINERMLSGQSLTPFVDTPAPAMFAVPPGTGRMSRAEAEAQGYWHPIGKNRLSVPFDQMKSNVIDNPSVVLDPQRTVTAEDLYKGASVPLKGDSSPTGKIITQVGNTPLKKHVYTGGGFDYGLDPNNIDLDTLRRYGWASDPGVLERIAAQIIRAGGKNQDTPVFLPTVGMTPSGIDFNTFMTKSLLEQFDPKGIPAEVAEMIDKMIRETPKKNKKTGTTTYPLKNFVGLKSDELESQLLKYGSGNLRKAFVGALEQKEIANTGLFPDVPMTRKANIHPQLVDKPLGDTGYNIYKADPKQDLVVTNPLDPHDTYPASMYADYFGSLDETVPYQKYFPDFFAHRRGAGKALATDDRAFSMSMPIQQHDDKWLAQFKEFLEERKKVLGYKEGGAIHVKPRKPKVGVTMMMARGGEVNADDLILEERRL